MEQRGRWFEKKGDQTDPDVGLFVDELMAIKIEHLGTAIRHCRVAIDVILGPAHLRRGLGKVSLGRAASKIAQLEGVASQQDILDLFHVTMSTHERSEGFERRSQPRLLWTTPRQRIVSDQSLHNKETKKKGLEMKEKRKRKKEGIRTLMSR